MDASICSGVKTMIQILSANVMGSDEGAIDEECSKEAGQDVSLLSRIGVRRLVLQPMDARLEYMRDLRIWLREKGWRITQVGGADFVLCIATICTLLW